MIFDFDLWELIRKWYLIIMCIIILILFSLIPLHIFTNITKSNKGSICDSEKQSKFILDCIKEDKTKTVVVIRHCERISIGLYCK